MLFKIKDKETFKKEVILALDNLLFYIQQNKLEPACMLLFSKRRDILMKLLFACNMKDYDLEYVSFSEIDLVTLWKKQINIEGA